LIIASALAWLGPLCGYPLVTLAGERRDIDWRGLGWSLPPRILGTVAGVAAVAAFSTDALGIVVGVMVLVAVLLTWRTVTIPMNAGTLTAAGLVSGFSGTATSIGGPPIAILYQHRPPRQIRTTMAVYFTVGAALSLAGSGSPVSSTSTGRCWRRPCRRSWWWARWPVGSCGPGCRRTACATRSWSSAVSPRWPCS
jgi:hypothetical protein